MDGVRQFGRGKVHGAQVVRGSAGDLFGGSIHQFQRAPYRIVDVHHGKAGMGGQKAGIAALVQGSMENFHRIIRSTASRWGAPRKNAGVTKRTHVQSVFAMVITTPQFAAEFGNSINRHRIHVAGLLGGVFGTVGAKNGDGTGPKNPVNPHLHTQIQNAQESIHVQFPRVAGSCLSGGR